MNELYNLERLKTDFTFKRCIVNQKKIKQLSKGLASKGGRSFGKITTPRRGALIKRIYRYIDRKRTIIPEGLGMLIKKVKFPQANGIFGLICYDAGFFAYVLMPHKINDFGIIKNKTKKPTRYGDSAQLKFQPIGSLIYNISLHPQGAAAFTRSAGCSSLLVRRVSTAAVVKLKSGELRLIPDTCMSTLGAVSNHLHHLQHRNTAGYTRRLGRRPRNRPSARNPVDHPMGGRTKGGSQPVNPQGRLLFGKVSKRFKAINILSGYRKAKFKYKNHASS